MYSPQNFNLMEAGFSHNPSPAGAGVTMLPPPVFMQGYDFILAALINQNSRLFTRLTKMVLSIYVE